MDLAGLRHHTKDLGDDCRPTQQFFGIHTTNAHGRGVAIFAGGVPLVQGGGVGAVGVSGGAGDQDQTVAEAAAAAF